MGWETVIPYIASAASAYFGSEGSKDAAKAQAGGGKNAIAEQQRQFNVAMRMLEPQRALGYGALQDIAGMYGYAMPQYTPFNALAAVPGAAGYPAGTSNWTMGEPVKVKGRKAPGTTAGLDTNPFSGGNKRYGATIDTIAGTVEVNAKKAKQQDKLSALATAYMRGDATDLKGRKMKRVRTAIDDLKSQGWAWSNLPPPQTAGIIDSSTQPNDPTQPDAAASSAGNFGRFFASPDYQFRLQEGQRAIDASAAARGSALSGNALRAGTEYASNLASGEYGNYMNRLFNIAGLGQTATNQAVTVGQNTANNLSNSLQGLGDSRASGIMGAANSVGSAINNGLSLYALQRFLNQPQPTAVNHGYSTYGPYASGYRFPGG